MAGAARCYEVVLRRMVEKQLPTADLEQEAIERLTTFLSASAESSDKWNITQAEVALRLASILMISSGANTSGSNDKYQAADRWLVRVRSFVEQQERDAVANEGVDRLKSRIAPFRMIALAGSGNVAEAEKQLTTIVSAPQDLLTVLEGLGPLVTGSNGNRRAQIAALLLKAAERLSADRSDLSAADAQRLDRALLMGYVSSSRTTDALVIARKLSEQSIKDATKQRHLALMFSDVAQEEAQTFTRQCWRNVEAATKAGSTEWLTARLGVIAATIRLKQHDEARKLLQITKVLYPDLKDPTLKARFNALEGELQAVKSANP
jgi:hypothetical protein